MYPWIIADGQLFNVQAVKMPWQDQGVLYGYGVFETILVKQSRPIFLKAHVDRLKYSAGQLGIPLPDSLADLDQAVQSLVIANQSPDVVLNIYLTGGDRDSNSPRWWMGVRKLPDDHPLSITVQKEQFARTLLDRFKSMSYLKPILEKKRASDFDDVLLYGKSGRLYETTMASVFLVMDKMIFTPKSLFVLPGIVRKCLLKKGAYFGFEIIEKPLFQADLQNADEIFLTNSLKGIALISQTNGYPHLKSGPISHSIKKAYDLFLESDNTGAFS